MHRMIHTNMNLGHVKEDIMIYTDLTRTAMMIAYNAHHGQFDKGGVPYVFHPIHVAEQMQDEYSTCVALLHDVVEDTSVSLEDLAKYFPQEIVEAVGLLTHSKSVPYEQYVRKVKENPLAKVVKLADIAHNTDFSRLSDKYANEKTILRLQNKYEKALMILQEE